MVQGGVVWCGVMFRWCGAVWCWCSVVLGWYGAVLRWCPPRRRRSHAFFRCLWCGTKVSWVFGVGAYPDGQGGVSRGMHVPSVLGLGLGLRRTSVYAFLPFRFGNLPTHPPTHPPNQPPTHPHVLNAHVQKLMTGEATVQRTTWTEWTDSFIHSFIHSLRLID